MALNIGDWVQREKRGTSHYVESIVSGDVVTRCGKRMKDEPNRDGELKGASPLEALFNRCKVCHR